MRFCGRSAFARYIADHSLLYEEAFRKFFVSPRFCPSVIPKDPCVEFDDFRRCLWGEDPEGKDPEAKDPEGKDPEGKEGLKAMVE